MLHQFDETEDYSSGKLWNPCPSSWPACAFVRDRMSTSIIYSGMKRGAGNAIILFSRSVGGVIVSSAVAQRSLLCGYAMDAGSRDRTCSPAGVSADCVPGCISGTHAQWCDPSSPSAVGGWCGGAAWRPENLKECLREHQKRSDQKYNELILESAKWRDSLPHTVTGFFAPKTSECEQNNCLSVARRARDAFVAEFNQHQDEVPLVWLRLDDSRQPFATAW